MDELLLVREKLYTLNHYFAKSNASLTPSKLGR
jgi:hypothetical protein